MANATLNFYPSISTGTPTGTLVTNGSNVQDWDFATGLTGDSLGLIEGWGEILCSASAQTYVLQPNGANPSSGDGYALQVNTAGVSSVNQGALLYIGTDFTNTKLNFRFKLDLKSGRNRLWTCQTETVNVANAYGEVNANVWRDTATQVTSLRIHCNVAGGILTNSFIVWWSTGITV